jgi:O-antigen/teichoic acid export membrane protein
VNRTLAKNIFSLTTAELISKTLTFLYTAYLARVILAEGLGVISLGQYIAGLFMLFNAGLDTYSIKIAAKNRNKLSETFNEIFSARLLLSLFSFALMVAVVLLLNKPFDVKFIILITGLSVVAQINYINWLFMAVEKFEVIAVRLIITSIINFAGIFLFVHNSEDVWIAAVVIVSSQLLNALWMILYYVRRISKIHLMPNIKNFATHLKSSVPINLSFMMILIYQNTGMILVGLLITTNYLYQNGILGAALKLMLIATIPMTILQQSFFPQLNRAESDVEKHEILSKYSRIMFLAGTIIATSVYFYSDYLITVAFGSSFAESTVILKMLSIAILLMFVNSTYAMPMIAWGREKQMFRAFASGTFTCLVINISMIPYYGMYASAVASIATELVILATVLFLIRKEIKDGFLIRLPLMMLMVIPPYAAVNYLLPAVHPVAAFIISLVISVTLLLISKQFNLNQVKGLLKKST